MSRDSPEVPRLYILANRNCCSDYIFPPWLEGWGAWSCGPWAACPSPGLRSACSHTPRRAGAWGEPGLSPAFASQFCSHFSSLASPAFSGEPCHASPAPRGLLVSPLPSALPPEPLCTRAEVLWFPLRALFLGKLRETCRVCSDPESFFQPRFSSSLHFICVETSRFRSLLAGTGAAEGVLGSWVLCQGSCTQTDLALGYPMVS